MDLEIQRVKLEEEKSKLTGELNAIAIPKKNGDDWDAVREEDPGTTGSSDEVADQLEGMNERKAAEVALEHQLAKVSLALEKIGAGTYGRCEFGEEMIEGDRLEANPAARTCKQHMEEEETLAQ